MSSPSAVTDALILFRDGVATYGLRISLMEAAPHQQQTPEKLVGQLLYRQTQWSMLRLQLSARQYRRPRCTCEGLDMFLHDQR